MAAGVIGAEAIRREHAPRLAAAVRLLASPAAVTFWWSRAAIWIVAVFGYFWMEPHRVHAAALSDTPFQHSLGYGLDLWAHWDGGWFLKIAQHSYASDVGTAAFFPLYPGAVGVLGRILAGQFVLAGILVSLAAALGSFLLLRELAQRHLDEGGAERAVLYLAIFPMSLFLQAVYSESLYLLLAVAAFLLAERGRWPWAAPIAGVSLLARPSAVAIYAGLAVLAWRAEAPRRAFAWLAGSTAIFLFYPLALWRQTGHPWAFVHAERIWGRHLSPLGPFGGIWHGLRSARGAIEQFAVGSNHPAKWTVPNVDTMHLAAINLMAFAFLLLYLTLIVLTFRWFGLAYGLFALVSIALPLSVPPAGQPLLSLPRFGLVAFPFFLVLARLGARPRAHVAIASVSAMLLGFFVAEWAVWEWVS